MLLELYCDKFFKLLNISNQNKILFHAGLNIVLGGNEGDNSIGKTTFLNIIDFVYGGNNYPTEDVIKNVGHHSIDFIYGFENEKFYFSRSTQNPGIVSKKDLDNKTIFELSIDEFRAFLVKKYNMESTEISFRESLQCYTRIYSNKKDCSRDPIKTIGDNKEKSLVRIIKLFQKYKEISDLLNKKKDVENKFTAYKEALKFDIVKNISAKQKKINEARIDDLQKEILAIEQEYKFAFANVQSSFDEISNDLKIEIAKLKRKRSHIKTNLHLLEQNQNIDFAKLNDKFLELKEFFPEINLKKIEDVEHFHKGLKEILLPDIQESKNQLQHELKNIDDRMKQICNNLNYSPRKESLPQIVFFQYAQKIKELEQITAENKLYNDFKAIELENQTIKKEFATTFPKITDSIQSSINSELNLSNDYICGDISSPMFIIKGINRYSYTNSQDEGTGANDRAILQFHLAMLRLTPIPILIEDSINFKNIEDEHTLKLLELFSKTPKQIFIALDKANHYSQKLNVPTIIQNNTVLKLERGKELFGKAWNVKN